jgi:UDPglucose 6-dehydrogenase
LNDIKTRMRHAIVLDGRNIYDPWQLQELGIAYCGIGRRNALGEKLLSHPHQPATEWA